MEAWHGFPFFTLLFMAALKGIPEELNEAAYVDGAGLRQRLRFVTLPMLKPIIVVSVILRVIGLVNSPELLLILTGGGPGHATDTISTLIYKDAFTLGEFGYSIALAVVLTIIVAIVSAGQYTVLNRNERAAS